MEGCNHQVSTRRRILARALPPEAWFRTVASSQPSTDPKERCLLARGPAGLRSPTCKPATAPDGLDLPASAGGEVRVDRGVRADQSEHGLPPHGTTGAEKEPPQKHPPKSWSAHGGARGLGAEKVPGGTSAQKAPQGGTASAPQPCNGADSRGEGRSLGSPMREQSRTPSGEGYTGFALLLI